MSKPLPKPISETYSTKKAGTRGWDSIWISARRLNQVSGLTLRIRKLTKKVLISCSKLRRRQKCRRRLNPCLEVTKLTKLRVDPLRTSHSVVNQLLLRKWLMQLECVIKFKGFRKRYEAVKPEDSLAIKLQLLLWSVSAVVTSDLNLSTKHCALIRLAKKRQRASIYAFWRTSIRSTLTGQQQEST